jgi:hypothetical protein
MKKFSFLLLFTALITIFLTSASFATTYLDDAMPTPQEKTEYVLNAKMYAFKQLVKEAYVNIDNRDFFSFSKNILLAFGAIVNLNNAIVDDANHKKEYLKTKNLMIPGNAEYFKCEINRAILAAFKSDMITNKANEIFSAVESAEFQFPEIKIDDLTFSLRTLLGLIDTNAKCENNAELAEFNDFLEELLFTSKESQKVYANLPKPKSDSDYAKMNPRVPKPLDLVP